MSIKRVFPLLLILVVCFSSIEKKTAVDSLPLATHQVINRDVANVKKVGNEYEPPQEVKEPMVKQSEASRPIVEETTPGPRVVRLRARAAKPQPPRVEQKEPLVCYHDLRSKEAKNKINAYLNMFFSRLDVYDVPNNTKASSVSNLNTGVGLGYSRALSPAWDVGIQVEFQKVKMGQSSSSRKLNELDKGVTQVQGDLSYKSTPSLSTYLRVSRNQLLFLEPSNTNFNLSTKSLDAYGLGFNHELTFSRMSIISNLGLNLYSSNYDGNIKVMGGQEYYGKLGVAFVVYKFPVSIQGYFKESNFALNYPMTNNAITQKNQEIGLLLGLSFYF
jgi:hypothetical protein